MSRFTLHSKRVLTDQGLTEATLIIDQGKIEDLVFDQQLRIADLPGQDLGNLVIMPGLIDSHVHINEPGRTDWEGFETATKAAAAGGITTIVDMPLNSSPVTTSVDAFAQKLDATENQLYVNCGFYGGLVPGSYPDLEPLLKSGVVGIKAFLTHSGIDEFPNVEEHDLREALPLLKKYHLPLLVHAELDAPHAGGQFLEQNPDSYQAYLRSRPKEWEDRAINMLIKLAKEFDHHIHVVHLSSAQSIATIKEAQATGYPITTETCPHYLCFNAENIPDRSTIFKCAPPIREKENNEQLWDAIQEQVIDFIVTDHSPSPPAMKSLESGSFAEAWGGIAGLQFSLPAIWSQAHKRGLSLEDVARFMSLNVAKFLKLGHKKGKLSPGYDADFVVWDPEESFEVREEHLYHRHKLTPYLGLTLNGVVKQTYVNGNKVYDQGTFGSAKGSLVLKS